MKHMYGVLAVILVLGSSDAYAGGSALRDDPAVAENITLLENWIQAQMEFDNIPGLAIAVVHDQELVWSRGFGRANLERSTAVTPQTVFRIASITKTFTSTAVMILRERGKLRLDDPVSQYLPWFSYVNRFPEGPAITIWHLLTHTSGLPTEAPFPYWMDYDKFPTREEMIAAFQKQESVLEPGTKMKYSNLAMAILGEVVAAASGMPYDRFIETEILTPLGMSRTVVNPARTQASGFATGYGRRLPEGTREVVPFMDARGIGPAANIASTVEDLARFASAHMQMTPGAANSLLRPASLREMHRVQWVYPGWKGGRGLGFAVQRTDEREVYGHEGWVGGNRSHLVISPAEKVAVIVMINADDGTPTEFTRRAMTMLAPVLAKAAAPQVAEAVTDPSWKLYAGRYSDPDGWVTDVLLRGGKLYLYGHSYPPEENPLASLVELVPEGPHVFRQSAQTGSGELVVFEIGKDGRVSRVKIDENYVTPVR